MIILQGIMNYYWLISSDTLPKLRRPYSTVSLSNFDKMTLTLVQNSAYDYVIKNYDNYDVDAVVDL